MRREDRRLIRAFNQGDAQALHRIYERYKPDLLGVARALLNDPAAVEDVLHDVFVAFAAQAGRFELRGSLRGYLAICVANRARNENRRGRKIDATRLADARGASAQPDSVGVLSERDQHAAVVRAMAQLPPEQRQVVALHVLSGLRFREIASQTGTSLNTAQSRYRYGIGKLRTLLNGQVTP